MREVDRLAEADYGITPIQLMEVAGLQTARVAREILGPSLAGRAVCILAGKGNNGADGLVAARRLAGWGADVRVVTSFEVAAATGLMVQQMRAARAGGMEVGGWAGTLPAAELYIDALLGFGAHGAPRGSVEQVVTALPHGARVLAVDIPSGLDAATGAAPGACVRATTTLTLALPKVGLLRPAARSFVGRLLVTDIGIPPSLLRRLGVDADGLFAEEETHVIWDA